MAPPDHADRGGPGGLSPRAVTWLGLAANATLAAGKIAVGLLFGSQAILADGFHSGTDLATDAAVLAGVGASAKPADRCHPYGHRRVATLVAMFVGSMLLVAAGSIAWQAVMSFRRGVEPVRGPVPLGMALLTVPVKEALFRMTRRVGRRTGDPSIVANAWHHRSDAVSSITAAVGLAVVAIGGAQWQFIDALTALVLSAFLAVAALGILRGAAGELIDRAPAAATLATIERAVEGTEGVRSHHAVRARQLGGKVMMDIHVLVDPELTVREGHDIASAVQRSVREAHPDVVEAVVHVEPDDADQRRRTS